MQNFELLSLLGVFGRYMLLSDFGSGGLLNLLENVKIENPQISGSLKNRKHPVETKWYMGF